MARGESTAVPGSARLGRFVARAREDLGLRQDELADRLGWSRKTVSKLENGHRPLYDVGEVVMLARSLELSEDEVWAAAGVPAREHPGLPGEPEFATFLRGVQEELAALRRLLEGASPPAEEDATIRQLNAELAMALAQIAQGLPADAIRVATLHLRGHTDPEISRLLGADLALVQEARELAARHLARGILERLLMAVPEEGVALADFQAKREEVGLRSLEALAELEAARARRPEKAAPKKTGRRSR